MRLNMLGGLSLEPAAFHRPKPLLLLAYLAVEGSKEKRHLYELFWPEAADQTISLRVALSQLRKVSAGLVNSDEHTLSTAVEHDLSALQKAISERDTNKLEGLYRGEFLQGFSLPDWGAELEEWVYSTREFVAARVRAALIRVAETEASQGKFVEAGQWAEKACRLGKDNQEPEELERLYALLLAGESVLSGEVKKQVKEYGVELNLSREEARGKYFVAPPEGKAEPQVIPHNLPRAKTSFIGRDPELVELGQMITQSEVQLITLLGQGGIGKTRLALQLAFNQLQENHFPDGIFFVALEALSEPSQTLLALAQTLELKVPEDVLAAVKNGIGNKRILLVLDNFEHLVEGALLVSELIEACPHLKLVVTSRERLNLEEEWVFSVQGLSLPKEASLTDAEYNDAIKLFVQRAKRARQEFALSTETLPHLLSICRQVEGSPLGIELAAVWLRSLPVADIAKEIGHNIGALEAPSRNIAERHQSLRAVFEHSWKLLGPKEQTTMARLTVFADGFAREAASGVCDATIPLLTSLVDKSLLRLNAEGRYDFHPLLHQFGGEKLAELPEEKKQTSAKHARYFLALAETSSNQGTPAQLKPEQQNLLGALAWSQEEGQALLGLRLGSALGSFWQAQGDLGEGIHWLRRVLSHPGAAAPSEERTNALLQAARIASMQGNRSLAQTYGQEALQLSQSLELEEHTVRAWLALAFEAHQQVDYAGGEKYAQAALKLARKIGHDELMAQAINALGVMLAEMDKSDLARPLFEESLALFRKLGRWPNVASGLSNLGYMVWIAGDLGAARAYLEEAVTMALDHHHLYIAALAQTNLGGVMQDLGDLPRARVLAGQVLESRWEQKDKEGLLHSLENLASLAVVQGDTRRAAGLWGVAERLQQEIKIPLPPFWQARHQRFVEMAKSQLDEANFTAAWQEGRRMELEDAVKWALKEG